MFVLLVETHECFVIEEPVATPLTVHYEIPAFEKLGTQAEGGDAHQRKAVKLTLTDRRVDHKVQQFVLADHKGEVQLDTVSDVAHLLCVKPVQKQTSPLRVDLAIERGRGDRYFDELAAREGMDKLSLEVVKLKDEIDEIQAEADYMKEKEVKFHKKAERVGFNLTWWPILQLGILVLTAIFQVNNLKGFFMAKNLY